MKDIGHSLGKRREGNGLGNVTGDVEATALFHVLGIIG